jgi:hypothetical protein
MTATRDFDLDIGNAREVNSFSYRILAFKRPKFAEDSGCCSALSLKMVVARALQTIWKTPFPVDIAR